MSNSEVKVVREETFKTIKTAMNKMVDFIRPTYGPAGNKIIISKFTHRMIVDDGVQAARDFELSDPAENEVVKIVREIAIRTNDRVGDGTTSSLIMGQAIINETGRLFKWSGREVELSIKKGLAEFTEKIRKSARQIKTLEELKKVARISFDDEKVSDMIANLYFKLGKDAVITIDKSPTMETTSETSDGVKIDSGYISQYMIANAERMETVFEKPYILITDYRMTEEKDILPIMEKMVTAGKRELVIIADNVEQHALATAVVNKLQGKFFVLAVVAPSGDNRKVFLEDLALLTGAKMFTESKGDKLENAEVADLGRATRFICRREESIIVGSKGKKAEVKAAIDQLRAAVEAEPQEKAKKELVKRLGMFTNTVAVIKVGAPTENEQKALKYKIEDAVHAVQAAYKGGVVCGGGIALASIKTSSRILNEALKHPHRQLMINMGLDTEIISNLKAGEAYNVVTGEQGDFMKVGVVDPVDVLIAGVESAVSIASILLTSAGMIVETPKDEPAQAGQ